MLTGRPRAARRSACSRQVDRLGLGDRVRRLGRIPAADVAGLYGLAPVVAVPSRYEGFGLPAVEAMAHGAPLVAADGTALPEVVGDAGVLVGSRRRRRRGPTAIVGLLDDSGRAGPARREAGRRGPRRYTWAANAAAFADAVPGRAL